MAGVPPPAHRRLSCFGDRAPGRPWKTLPARAMCRSRAPGCAARNDLWGTETSPATPPGKHPVSLPRPRTRRSRGAHRSRRAVPGHCPVLVTPRVRDDVPRLRCGSFVREFRKTLRKGADRSRGGARRLTVATAVACSAPATGHPVLRCVGRPGTCIFPHPLLTFASPAPVAQLDRALASEAKGHRFESCRARQLPWRVTRCHRCGDITASIIAVSRYAVPRRMRPSTTSMAQQ